MEKYKRMYAILCAAASEAIDALPYLPETLYARCLLEKALLEAEDVYIDGADGRNQAELATLP